MPNAEESNSAHGLQMLAYCLLGWLEVLLGTANLPKHAGEQQLHGGVAHLHWQLPGQGWPAELLRWVALCQPVLLGSQAP